MDPTTAAGHGLLPLLARRAPDHPLPHGSLSPQLNYSFIRLNRHGVPGLARRALSLNGLAFNVLCDFSAGRTWSSVAFAGKMLTLV